MFVWKRFWWERKGVFSRSQKEQLRTVSLSRIICDNSHITRVPVDPFSRTERPEDMLACSHPLIPHLDLSPWKEPDTGEEPRGDAEMKIGVISFYLSLYQIPAAVQYPEFSRATPFSATLWFSISVTLGLSWWDLHQSAVIQKASSGVPAHQHVMVRTVNWSYVAWIQCECFLKNDHSLVSFTRCSYFWSKVSESNLHIFALKIRVFLFVLSTINSCCKKCSLILFYFLDINECEEPISPCPQNLECFNTASSFICSGQFSSFYKMFNAHDYPNPEHFILRSRVLWTVCCLHRLCSDSGDWGRGHGGNDSDLLPKVKHWI